MIDYYARVADAILPHLRGRPLTLRRFPEGVGNPQTSFFEKNCPKHRPEWVKTTPIYVDRRAGEIDFCLCENRPTLIWMAQLAALELHPSLSKATRMEQPTVLAFDLDPGAPAGLRRVLQGRPAACASCSRRFGLEGFPKVSGGKGLQVYVPLNTKVTYEQTSPFAKAVAQLLEKQTPKDVVSKMAKVDRRGKVFVDWSQNHQKKTTIAVYSLRAREHPTASIPLHWREVERDRQGRRGREAPLRDPGCDQADREGGRPLRARAQAAKQRKLPETIRRRQLDQPAHRLQRLATPAAIWPRADQRLSRTTGLRSAATSSSRRTGVV